MATPAVMAAVWQFEVAIGEAVLDTGPVGELTIDVTVCVTFEADGLHPAPS